jgi:hypothetical protein
LAAAAHDDEDEERDNDERAERSMTKAKLHAIRSPQVGAAFFSLCLELVLIDLSARPECRRPEEAITSSSIIQRA